MLDIIDIQDGKDLILVDSVVMKAGNVLGVQLGSLEYAPDFGVDKGFFLTSELKFQDVSFKAYLVQRLSENQINVSDVLDIVEQLMQRYQFFVGDASPKNEGFIL